MRRPAPGAATNADTFFAFPDLATIKQANEGWRRAQLPQRRARADCGAPGSARVRLSAGCGAGQDHRAAPARERAPGAAAQAADRRAVAGHDTALAEQYFMAASALDEGDDSTQEEAATAYAKALELDPYLVAALINLANIHYRPRRAGEGQALYERAIGLEPDFFEAHFNLGTSITISAASPKRKSAIASATAQPVLRRRALLPRGHVRKDGQSQAARPHWRSYQQLRAAGEWVELAREF